MVMTPTKFWYFEGQVQTFRNEINYFNNFYDDIKSGDVETGRKLYDEAMKHANSALEIYEKLTKDSDLLETFRNSLDPEKGPLEKKIDELKEIIKGKKELVGV
jgi:hypothetical protein